MPTTNKVNQLVINKVESLEVYEALKAKGLSDEEIYLLTPEGIQTALENIEIDVDSALNTTSTNPVQNKVITAAINNIKDTKVNTTLATTSKAYLLGTTTTPTSSAKAVTSVSDTGVYLGTTAGELVATHLTATDSVNMGRKTNTTIGTGSTALGINVEASGNYSHAEGDFTTASGNDSHAEGVNTTASGNYSHAEGYGATASGEVSHAEGYGATASGRFGSHAEGQNTVASGDYSHAEGYKTIASDGSAHAEGFETLASKAHSHAEGQGTIAGSYQQHVQGKYNIEDASYTYAHIVGNGSREDERSNAHTLDWNGNAWFAGDVYTGSTSGTNKDTGSKKLATEEFVTQEVGKIEIPNLSGGTTATNDATVVGGVTVSGHNVSVGKKTLTPGSNIQITGSADKITIAATDTKYGAGTGLELNGTTFNHKNSVTAGTASGTATTTLGFGGKFNIPTVSYDAQGHVTGKGTTTITLPSAPTIPTLSKGTDENNSSNITISNKKATFTVLTDTKASNHTVTDVNTTFTLDLSDYAELGDLSTAMVFKGTLGTGGTITALPTASNTLSSDTVGDTYKVITAGTYAGIAAKVGDVFICSDKPEWVLIPSGDEPSGTVTNIATGTDLTGGPITSAGTISHANITRTNPTVTTLTPGYAGTFNVVESVTTSNTGHVTAVQVRKVTMPSAQTIPVLNKKTATVLTSATTISHSGGVATTNKIKATASGTAVGANGTASVVTGYPNVTNASFVNSVTPSTTTVVNGVSNTTAKALTGLGTASTVKAVTSYAAPTNASFVNSVTNTTTNVVSSVSNTTAAALTGLGTASTVKAVTGYTPTNASFVNGVTNTTTSVVSSVTSGSISVSNGILTIPKKTMLTGSSSATVINKVSSTTSKALTGLGTAATSNVVTGYASPTTANFVNSVSSGTTTVINKVSSTTSKALTGLGTASTTDVVTGYPNITNASFVNGVGKTTTTVVNGISNTTAKALTGLGTPSTATALTGVKITAQPTVKLEFDSTNGQVSVVTGVSTPSITLNQNTVNALTDATTLG